MDGFVSSQCSSFYASETVSKQNGVLSVSQAGPLLQYCSYLERLLAGEDSQESV